MNACAAAWASSWPSCGRPCRCSCRFSGIDYDRDPEAEGKLDQFIRQVQTILAQYEGNLIQLTFGDKGSYLYAAFGAPVAHEDDALRAASTALALRDLAGRLDFIDEAGWASPRAACVPAPTAAAPCVPTACWATPPTCRPG